MRVNNAVCDLFKVVAGVNFVFTPLQYPFRVFSLRRSLLYDAGILSKHDCRGAAHHSRHGHRWPVVVAALCAGLYPNVARADIGRGAFRKCKLFVREHGNLDPHPGSVNAAGGGRWQHRWVIYFDKVKTINGLFVYDSTEVCFLL